MRIVSWFSCGVASAVCAKLLLAKREHEIEIIRIQIDNEHPDNERFAADCENWFGQHITTIRSDKYEDCWDVWEKRRYLVGPRGAQCTKILKADVRKAYQREHKPDMQAFGYTAEEAARADQFRRQNPEVGLVTPLITARMGKVDCLALIERAGIELPAMYRLGYHNNNCIGCVKGGAGYWNKIRVDFPDVFARMSRLERTIGASICKVKGIRTYLDELPPDAGRHDNLEMDCSLLCVLAEQDIKEDAA